MSSDVEVLAEALKAEMHIDADHGFGATTSQSIAATLLAAMPDYTLVRKDEIERLRAALEARAAVLYRSRENDEPYMRGFQDAMHTALAATEGKRRTT